MSFLAKLSVDDLDNEAEINVISCNYHFQQPRDSSSGHVTGKVIAGEINVVVESTKWTGLLHWLINGEEKDGKIVFNSREQEMTRNKTLEFKNAICTSYSESFNGSDALPMTTSISIFAESIQLGDVWHETEWKRQ
jgi:hypothetical protein